MTLRPIRPEDEPLMVAFHKHLSEGSVYSRYFHALKLSQRITHERLTRICFIDYDRELALVADRLDELSGQNEIVAVGRLSKHHRAKAAEFALIIRDEYQGRGLGSAILRKLIEVARNEGVRVIVADILPQNRAMQAVCSKLGFVMVHDTVDQFVRAELVLEQSDENRAGRTLVS